MPQDTTRILLEEAANPQNDPECFGLWMALGLRSEYHGVGIDWVQVFAAINARWGHDGVEQIKVWAHQRFVEAWEHDFSNYLISIGGEDEF
jgi:hypothetical protein